jgi:acyl phosphate:glycerol-3-phosphate acyltransferase
MTVVFSILCGYFIGSLPTANAIAGLRNIDLREGGSGNPGTNNARKLGGLGLAIPILIVELAKGVACVLIGSMLAGDIGAVVAGISGIAGNVFNIWYRFAGGKGLAIGGGVLLALWPLALVAVVISIIIGSAVAKSSGIGSLLAISVMVALAFAWAIKDWPNIWGIGDVALLPYFAIASGLILVPRHLIDARSRLREPSRP